jgi:hypothetical protein
MTSGYSTAPLFKKLGLRPGLKLLVINPPDAYQQMLEIDWKPDFCKQNERPDIVHLFVKSYQEFLTEMTHLQKIIHPKIVIWVSWYKKAAKVKTDINEDIIRNFALENNLVDIKVCSVSEVWSGLKLVVPLSKR